MIRTTCPLIAASALLIATMPALADEWTIDASHSGVFFKVKHVGIGNQQGRFNEIAGSLDTGDAAAFEFTVPAASIDTNNDKRDDHLRSPDFFNVKQFPVISFTGESITPNDEGMALTGELTLHGVTQPFTAQMIKIGEGDDPWGNYRIGLETTITIKRTDFGMDQMLDAVGDEVTLTISLEAIKE